MATNPTALIVGGSSGIGLAVAQVFAAAGWQICIASRDPGRREQALASLAPGAHLGVTMDIQDQASVQAGVDNLLAQRGRVDLLVNSAVPPHTGGMPWPVPNLPLADWQGMLATLLDGTFLTCRAVQAPMRAQGAGTIVNIGSALSPKGMRGRAFAPAYSAAKYATLAFTQALHAEMETWGGRALVVSPGTVDTPLIANTALAREFGGSIQPAHLARHILRLVTLPETCLVPDSLVLPFRGANPQP